MNVEPPETLVIIESIVYKSNGFAISYFIKLTAVILLEAGDAKIAKTNTSDSF